MGHTMAGRFDEREIMKHMALFVAGDYVTLRCSCGNEETKHEGDDWLTFKVEAGWVGEGCTMINYWCMGCHRHEKERLFVT